MCRACEEEALYQAYLDAMARKATEAAASATAPRDREEVKARSNKLSPGKPEISARKAGGKS